MCFYVNFDQFVNNEVKNIQYFPENIFEPTICFREDLEVLLIEPEIFIPVVFHFVLFTLFFPCFLALFFGTLFYHFLSPIPGFYYNVKYNFDRILHCATRIPEIYFCKILLPHAM